MSLWVTSTLVPFETGLTALPRVGLVVDTICHLTDLTQHTNDRKGSAPR
jgi:hypothetical protein